MADVAGVERPFFRRTIAQRAHQRCSDQGVDATRATKAMRWSAFVTLVSICALASSTQAAPISPRVKTACRYDYYKLCSAYDVGSQELRQCMDSMGDRLSQGCIEALIAAGEISQREVDSRKADH
jgi:hypothetical protein